MAEKKDTRKLITLEIQSLETEISDSLRFNRYVDGAMLEQATAGVFITVLDSDIRQAAYNDFVKIPQLRREIRSLKLQRFKLSVLELFRLK